MRPETFLTGPRSRSWRPSPPRARENFAAVDQYWAAERLGIQVHGVKGLPKVNRDHVPAVAALEGLSLDSRRDQCGRSPHEARPLQLDLVFDRGTASRMSSADNVKGAMLPPKSFHQTSGGLGESTSLATTRRC